MLLEVGVNLAPMAYLLRLHLSDCGGKDEDVEFPLIERRRESMDGTEGLSEGWQFFSLDRKQALKAEFDRLALPQFSHLHRAAFYLIKDKTDAEDLIKWQPSFLSYCINQFYCESKRSYEGNESDIISMIYCL